jgi:hypothetical protein
MTKTSSPWRRAFCGAALLAALLVQGAAHAADTAPCQKLPGTALKHVEVFEGPPEELASLTPDDDSKASSRFTLDYIYNAGHFVTIRCEYANGKATDIKLSTKVDACTSAIGKDKTISFSCR